MGSTRALLRAGPLCNYFPGAEGAFSGTEATIGDGMKKLIETLIEMAYAQIGTLELQIESYKRFLDTLEGG